MKSWPGDKGGLPALAAVLLATGACTPLPVEDSAPRRPPDVSAVPDAVPRDEPRSRYGNPAVYEVFGKRYHVMDSAAGYRERGVASWYGRKFHGRRTSSGEIYDMYAMTAAHKALPLPTFVRVTNLENGRSAVVRVNDRGPFVHNRIIDLSYTAAMRLGIVEKGTGIVEIEALAGQPPEAILASGTVPEPPPATTPATIEPPAVSLLPGMRQDDAGDLFAQLGAFADPLNAETLRDELADRGFGDARITADPVGERIVYRVRIGPLEGVPAFDATVERLEAAGFVDVHPAYE